MGKKSVAPKIPGDQDTTRGTGNERDTGQRMAKDRPGATKCGPRTKIVKMLVGKELVGGKRKTGRDREKTPQYVTTDKNF